MRRAGRVVPALVRRRLAVLRVARPASSPGSTRTRPASGSTPPARSTRRSPLGGYEAFEAYGNRERTFTSGSSEAGYTTGFVGKFLNGYEYVPGGEVPASARRAGATSTSCSARRTTAGASPARTSRTACCNVTPGPAPAGRAPARARRTSRTPARSPSGWRSTSSTATATTAAVLPRGGAVRAAQPGQPEGALPGRPALPAGVPRPPSRGSPAATAACVACSELGVEDLPGLRRRPRRQRARARRRQPGARVRGTRVETSPERGRARPARPGADGAVDRPDGAADPAPGRRRTPTSCSRPTTASTSASTASAGQGRGVRQRHPGAAAGRRARASARGERPRWSPTSTWRRRSRTWPGSASPALPVRALAGADASTTRRWAAATTPSSSTPGRRRGRPRRRRRRAQRWSRRTSPCAAATRLLIRTDLDPTPDGTDYVWEFYEYADAGFERTNTYADPQRPGELAHADSASCTPFDGCSVVVQRRRRSRGSAATLDAVGCAGGRPGRGGRGPPRLLHVEPRAPRRRRHRTAAAGGPARRGGRRRRARAHSTWCCRPARATPTSPADFAVGREVLRAGTRPVLGVCLGMQGLVTTYGGTVDRASARARRGGADRATTGRACSAGCRRASPPSATTRSRPSRCPTTWSRPRTWRGRATVMGVRHVDAAARGRAVPPRVDPVRARRGAGRELPGAVVSPWIREEADPVAYFRDVAAAAPALLLAGRRRRARVVGPPVDDRLAGRRRRVADVRRRPARGRRGTPAAAAEVVGDDVFAALEAEIAAGSPDDQWFGYLGYACRPDLPGRRRRRPAGRGVDAGAARAAVRPPGSRTTIGREPQARPSRSRLVPNRCRPPARPTPRRSTRVQEHLHAGNSYEVNLTYRLETGERPGPGGGVPPAARRSTPRRTPGSSSTTCPATGRGCSARRRSGTPWSPPTGCSRPSRSRGRRRAARRRPRTRCCGERLAQRAEVPRGEPDDRRPAPQRPVDGLRARDGRGAGADGGRVVRDRAPAGVDRARPARRRGHRRSARCARCSRPGR